MALIINSEQLTKALTDMGGHLVPVLEAGLSAVADSMEADAKRDAPWTDRTGNARRTMTGFVTCEDDSTLVVGVAGHMHYSPDLELRHGRRFAVLVPTVDRYAPTILQAVTKAVLAQGGIEIE